MISDENSRDSFVGEKLTFFPKKVTLNCLLFEIFKIVFESLENH